jgi:tRNA-2-methylthio-N6-dimethylallyladenosine synthase
MPCDPKQRTFHVVTFGCQMNKLDSELLCAALVGAGWRQTAGENGAEAQEADVVIYSTCSVRQQAENRVLSHLGAWRRRVEREPAFIVGVVGCMAQRLGAEIVRRFPHVRLVCGTRAFHRVPEHLERIAATGEAVVDLGEDEFSACRDPALRPERHHAFVSIMRGCDNFCAYCVVPYVRGRPMSRPPADIAEEVRRLCGDGVVEVALLGQNVNAYGKGRDEPVGLAALLERVSDTPGLERLRFLTNHPGDMTEDILRAVASLDVVCEHLHMPAQSGADAVLERMGRGYAREEYVRIVEAARRIVPGIELSSDFIVGFPGETDGDFEKTLGLLEGVRFQQSFIFKYSPRPGTLAARWADDVADAVKRERNQRLLAAQARIDTERRRAMVGTEVEVMVDGRNPDDREGRPLRGRTRGNDIVFFSGPALAPGTVTQVRIEDATPLTLFGSRCE